MLASDEPLFTPGLRTACLVRGSLDAEKNIASTSLRRITALLQRLDAQAPSSRRNPVSIRQRVARFCTGQHVAANETRQSITYRRPAATATAAAGPLPKKFPKPRGRHGDSSACIRGAAASRPETPPAARMPSVAAGRHSPRLTSICERLARIQPPKA